MHSSEGCAVACWLVVLFGLAVGPLGVLVLGLVTPDQFRRQYTFLAPTSYVENYADILVCRGKYQVKPALSFAPGQEVHDARGTDDDVLRPVAPLRPDPAALHGDRAREGRRDLGLVA